MKLLVFEVDYSLKDVEKFKASGTPLPQLVVAESVVEAVKRAKEFEDDNATLLKCDIKVAPSNVAIQKKTKGMEPAKETA